MLFIVKMLIIFCPGLVEKDGADHQMICPDKYGCYLMLMGATSTKQLVLTQMDRQYLCLYRYSTIMN